MVTSLRSSLVALALAVGTPACLAPPPPIVVETPFGDVRAENQDTADQIAGLLCDLSPRVQALLPGSQERSVDVWVQEELRVYRHRARPESVRGFTLLADEFDARRIHLQEDGQSPWYLAHELVHALIDEEWSTLPGILEEGLADVIAEELNPEQRIQIRAHRLLNASAFTNGLELEVLFRMPDAGAVGASRDDDLWRERSLELRRRLVLRLADPIDQETARELLTTDRTRLHHRWPEIPEAYYGFAWLLVARIHERSGLGGLFGLCARAREEGHDLVPIEWLLEAADMTLEGLDAAFLARCFRRDEFQRALYLRPEAFTQAALRGLEPLENAVDTRQLFFLARPAFVLPDGGRVPMSSIGPVRQEIKRRWSASSLRPDPRR